MNEQMNRPNRKVKYEQEPEKASNMTQGDMV